MWSLWAVTECETHALNLQYHLAAYPPEKRDPALVAAALAALPAPFAVLDKALAEGGGFVMGGRFTVADINVAEIIRYARPARSALRRRAPCESLARGLSRAPGLQGDVAGARGRAGLRQEPGGHPPLRRLSPGSSGPAPASIRASRHVPFRRSVAGDELERLAAACRPVAALGRRLLLRQDRGGGMAAAGGRAGARRAGGGGALSRCPPVRPLDGGRRPDLAGLLRHGADQQPHSVRPDLLGPDPDRQRPRLDPERHDAAVRRRRRPSLRRGREGDRASNSPASAPASSASPS